MTFTASKADDFTEINNIYRALQNLVYDKLFYELNETEEDLQFFQKVIEQDLVNDETFYLYAGMGFALAKLIMKRKTGFNWAILEDEHGTDLVLRYKKTDFQIDALNMIGSKIAEGELLDIEYMLTYLLNYFEEHAESLENS